MICTVSTVKDSSEHLENFVERNLASGADHMFLFLDGGDTNDRLGGHPHVTVVTTDEDYWAGRRPDDLNLRQVVNANLVNVLLAPVTSAAWLFHIDSDECLDLDKERLLALEASVDYVRLEPREALSRRHWSGEVTHFKQLLGREELSLLTSLGVIAEPRNLSYFNGHIAGKVGVRPSVDVRLLIHRADRHESPRPPSYRADFLHVLHYESHSGDEFVRKWARHIGSGTGGRFKPDRMLLRAAIAAVLDNEHLSDERRRHYLAELYRRHVEDDAETLLELGFLVELDQSLHAYRPTAFAPPQRRLVDRLLDRLLPVDKAWLRPGGDTTPADVLRWVRGQLGYVDRGVAAAIDACLERQATGGAGEVSAERQGRE